MHYCCKQAAGERKRKERNVTTLNSAHQAKKAVQI